MSKFFISTRKSKMALAQSELVSKLLKRVAPGLEVELAQNNPRGDRDQVSRLDRHGGKGGAFVAEIRADILAGNSQCAMHSLKDMPGNEEVPELVIGAYLKREDPTDSFVLRPGLSMDELSASGGTGRKVGTNSVRRAAYIRRLFPNMQVLHCRGAADTRIRKLDEGLCQELPDGSQVGPFDAIILATSGLARIGMSDRVDHSFSIEEMLPAVGQGIVAVECAAEDWKTRALLSLIDDAEARHCAMAERELLWVLNGHCNSPIAAHASILGDHMLLRAAVMSLDGETILEHKSKAGLGYPRELGRDVALQLIEGGAAKLIEAAAQTT